MDFKDVKSEMTFKDSSNEGCLAYNVMKDDSVVEGICYIVNVNNAISAIETNYYRLIVRTVDNVLIPCLVFNSEDFTTLGFKLNSLKNKYVKLRARVNEFNGRLSLKFISLSIVEDVTVDLVTKFKTVIDNLEGYYTDLNNVFSNYVDEKFPIICRSKSYPDLYKGQIGGFVKLSWEMMVNCQSMASDLANEDFMKILFYSLIGLKEYLDKQEQFNLVTDSDKIEMISRMSSKGHVDRLIRESVSCLIGLTKPNHIIPVIIYNSYNFIMSTQNIKNNWEMLRPGGVSECEGLKLIKY